jgi:hypothetical protein
MADLTAKGDSGRGYIDIRPDMIEHFAAALAGGVGRAGTELAGTVAGLAAGEKVAPREMFLARVFMGEASPYAIDKRYSVASKEIDQAKARYDELRKAGEGRRALDWRLANLPLFQAIGPMQTAERLLSNIPNTPENEERRRSVKARFNRTYKELITK